MGSVINFPQFFFWWINGFLFIQKQERDLLPKEYNHCSYTTIQRQIKSNSYTQSFTDKESTIPQVLYSSFFIEILIDMPHTGGFNSDNQFCYAP